jgi:hypothetical protein
MTGRRMSADQRQTFRYAQMGQPILELLKAYFHESRMFNNSRERFA